LRFLLSRNAAIKALHQDGREVESVASEAGTFRRMVRLRYALLIQRRRHLSGAHLPTSQGIHRLLTFTQKMTAGSGTIRDETIRTITSIMRGSTGAFPAL
jgi:hypothetical protein